MSKITRVIIQKISFKNINREEVKNSEIRYLPDLYIFNKIKMATKLIIKNILMNEIVCSSMKMARNLIIKKY